MIMILVLIIEDNLEIRENTGELLQLQGYRVMEANNGSRGLELALENKPDIILCDIMMPGLNGYEVLAALKQNPATATTPFIFLTANSEKKEIQEGLNLGANAYLSKPFEAEDLFSEIRKLTAR